MCIALVFHYATIYLLFIINIWKCLEQTQSLLSKYSPQKMGESAYETFMYI